MSAFAYRRLAFVSGFAATGALALALGGRAIAQGVEAALGTIPTDVQMPGTQPDDVLFDLHDPNACASCHGSFNPQTEPTHLWRGSMMSHASRDPLFWATLAIAEQDFAGGGDFCLRCHVPSGWLAGRSVPTDGAALDTTRDVHGVECDQCHRLTNPDNSEHLGVQSPPFVANSGGPNPVGYYGSGQYVMWNGAGTPYETSKLGPYATTAAPHGFAQSQFHRSSDLCGTCHDVSNPFTGDLAPGNGASIPLAPGTFSGVPGTPVDGKAAFNNFPYQYGVVERTFSEHRASLLDTLPVSQFGTLPLELQRGAISYAYQQALQAGTGGNFADGSVRSFTCQSCHMAPTVGPGCNFASNVRSDLARHDLTGGNYWMPDAIQWMDQQGLLILGGGLTPAQITAMNDGKLRARQSLSRAASLTVTGNTLRIVNLTGHKLITGYPEGRRMWVNARWYDAGGLLLREDGAYGPITAIVQGQPTQVDTILDLVGTNTKIYESHGAISQAWAQKLINVLGVAPSLVVAFDRVTGAPTTTLADVAAQAPGTAHESFHFLLNDTVVKDNRIPPYGMSYDEARTRNALPVPEGQYGSPGTGGAYEYFDQLAMNPPVGATFARLDLVYQPTSWEYIQFLYRANTGQVVRLAQEGVNLLNAWRNTGMAAPHVMASVSWGTPTLSAGDCQVVEGNGGTTTCDFEISLSGPATQMVFLDYATADGSATVADGDYAAAAGSVSFSPGDTTETVTVTVNGDVAPEVFETFSLDLSNAFNATILDGQGTGTIQNDDTATASISDCTVIEGNAGSVACVATVSLDVPTIHSPIVEWAPVDFTATRGIDYLASGGFLAFQPGSTSQNVTISVIGDTLPEINETFFLRLSLAAPPVLIGDGDAVGTIVNDDVLPGGVAELSHGFTLTTDLAAPSAGVADRDLYVMAQQPYSSYEVVVDAASGDLGSAGPLLERRSPADTLLQSSAPVGGGSGRTLRWQNSSFPIVAGERVVVSATGVSGCGATCGPDDVYRIRAWDTTCSIPRFNNSGSQVTILIIENPGSSPIQGHAWLWTDFGVTPADVPFTLAPRATLVLNTATVLPSQSGSITVTHDGGYGALSGKTVALEPATGFSFDSPMIPRAR